MRHQPSGAHGDRTIPIFCCAIPPPPTSSPPGMPERHHPSATGCASSGMKPYPRTLPRHTDPHSLSPIKTYATVQTLTSTDHLQLLSHSLTLLQVKQSNKQLLSVILTTDALVLLPSGKQNRCSIYPAAMGCKLGLANPHERQTRDRQACLRLSVREQALVSSCTSE